MQLFLLIPLYAIFNAIRGSGRFSWFSRVTSASLCANALQLLLPQTFTITQGFFLALLTFFGLWAALAPGWGIGFACVTGRRNFWETEIPWLDKLADALCRNDNTVSDNRKWGFVWMTARGSFFYGLFILYGVLRWYYGLSVKPPLVYGLLTLLMGLVYWLTYYIPDESKRIRVAEFSYGAILGTATALSFFDF